MSDNPLGTGSIEAAASAFAAILDPKEDNQDAVEAQEPETLETDDQEQSSEATAEDDEQSDDDQPEDEPEEPRYRVKVNGEEVEVPLSEALKGYQRQADYSRKTEELARIRREAEARTQAEADQLRAERQHIQNLLSQLPQQQEEQVDWDHLRATDPIEFAARWAERQKRQEDMRGIEAERQRLTMIQHQEQQMAMARHLEAERQRLLDVVPEWKDSEVSKRERSEVIKLAKRFGYSDEELAGASDHRAIAIMRLAAKYMALTARKPEPTQVTKTLKPSAANTVRPKSEFAEAKRKLAQTGRVEDAAKAFKFILGDS